MKDFKIFYGLCATLIGISMFFMGWDIESKTIFIAVSGACLGAMQGGSK